MTASIDSHSSHSDHVSSSHEPFPTILDPQSLPKISIVTPSYNQGRYLEKTILSVLEQGYPNLEYIIIDGGSSDESVEIIKKYADRLTYWVSEPDRGQSHAINKGFARATGEIFGWLNSDDWYHPGALQAVAAAFAAHPEAGAIVGTGDMTDGFHSVVISSFDISSESLYGWMDRFFMQPSCFFSKRAWLECGPLAEDLNFAMDLDFWIRIAGKFPFIDIADTLSTSLIHPDAKTTACAGASLAEVALVVARHGGVEQSLRLNQRVLVELIEKRQSLAELQAKYAHLENTLLVLENQIAERDRWLAERNQCLAERYREIFELTQQKAELQAAVDALHASLSWKVTRPLRWLGGKIAG